ncbi:anion permease [Algoriphagus vanfongensis]|uniref:anion permease n=1 Tax=Algoriphagus vanfongensis TaxID=426371 RepID=UPI00047D7807
MIYSGFVWLRKKPGYLNLDTGLSFSSKNSHSPVLGINFLTEITSNLATTAMFLPVLAPMAFTLDVHPYLLMVPVAMAASCAFMLPVATPPNAVVMGSGYLKIKDMMRAGLWLNLISVLIITISCYYLLELVWGFDPLRFPVGFQKPE